MRVEVRLPATGGAARIEAGINRIVLWLTRHWVALFNLITALFVGLPFLAPLLMAAGATGPARLIYTIYAPTCHQLPERSFFLFGPQLAYRATDLEALGVLPAGINILERQALRFIGTPDTGYKVAICERDVAIYGSLLLSGLLFAVLRPGILRRAGGKLPKMPVWLYGLLLAPMAVDGLTQIVGLRESTWPLRLLTGGLFGMATVWLAYPYVQEAMDDVLRTSAPSAPASADSQRQAPEIARAAPQTGQKPPFAV